MVGIDISIQSVVLARSIIASVGQRQVPSWTAGMLADFPPSLRPLTAQLIALIGDGAMAARDYEAAPASEALGLVDIIRGLAGDLDALRAGSITVQDAIARSLLAKQIFNGVRIYLNGTKLLSDQARQVGVVSSHDRVQTPINKGDRDGTTN
jgi:hypothetical protein